MDIKNRGIQQENNFYWLKFVIKCKNKFPSRFQTSILKC